ncbi:MAG: hypothetical protein NC311_07780 [Muribaculaceae bacterium]|nr:hypothetical protein [Muribaculaceae bacterium]
MKFTQKLREKIMSTKWGKRFFEEYEFKTFVLSLISLIITVAFVVMNCVSAVLYSSVWYASVAGYYGALIAFRAGVLIADRKCRKRFCGDEESLRRAQNNIYLASGAFLIIVQIAMCGAVSTLIIYNRPQSGGQIMAIANAAYAFWKITTAIINLVRAKKHGDLTAQSLRNLNFADACMSIVSLTVLLLSVFGENDDALFLMTMKCGVGFSPA